MQNNTVQQRYEEQEYTLDALIYVYYVNIVLYTMYCCLSLSVFLFYLFIYFILDFISLKSFMLSYHSTT